MIVIDASVAVTDDTDVGQSIRAELKPRVLLAPHIIDLEVLSAVRSYERLGSIESGRAATAIQNIGRTSNKADPT